MDGQHSLWSDADACLSDCSGDNVIDILDIVHVAGYVGKAAKALVRGEVAQEEFIRERLLRILRGDVHGAVRGLRRMAPVAILSKTALSEPAGAGPPAALRRCSVSDV